MLNLAVVLEDSARNVPDTDAVVHGKTRLSYAELDAAASQVAAALAARGIGPGDRVALSCPNLPYFPVVYYGILKAGATVVPLNILLTEREIAYHLDDSAARAYLCFEGTAELPTGQAGRAAFDATESCEHFVLLTADPDPTTATSPSPATETLAEFTRRQPTTFSSAATNETDTAVILYTSGTTGQPKGAELTHSNMVHNALLANRLFGLHPHDVHLTVLPLFHSFGQTVQMNAGFATGATVVLMPRFDAGQALELMQAEQVTFFAGVPTMYHALLNCEPAGRFDIPTIAARMRIAVSGGAALPVELMRRFEERFGVPILEGYGLSETSPIATFNRVDRPRRPGSIGLPVWGVEVQIIRDDGSVAKDGEPGEITIRGHNVMKGYFRRPRRGGQGVRGPHPWRGDHRGRPHRLVPAEHGGLQVPAGRRVPRQPAHDRHGQDPQAAARPAARARRSPAVSAPADAFEGTETMQAPPHGSGAVTRTTVRTRSFSAERAVVRALAEVSRKRLSLRAGAGTRTMSP